MSDLQTILKKIRALRARAECSASTEAEAEMAARIAAELLAKHNITLTELEVKADGVDRHYWQSGRNVRPIEACALRGINSLCNVKSWFQGGTITIIGAPADSELALYYLDIVKAAINSCWNTHRNSIDYMLAQVMDESGISYAASFKKGVASRLGERFGALAVKPETQTTSNALVVAKGALIKTWMDEHNINLRSSKSSLSNASGYVAGRSAADSVALNKGLNSQRTNQKLLS